MPIKTSRCSHKYGCNCQTLYVADRVQIFGQECVAVAEGCTMHYYSIENGREMGNKKGVYESGNIMPWCIEDQQEMDKKASDDAIKKHLEARAKVLELLLIGKQDGFYDDIKNHMSLDQIDTAIMNLEA